MVQCWQPQHVHCCVLLVLIHPCCFLVQVNKLEITADKQLLAAAGNPAVKIFEVAAAAPQPIHSFDGHTGNVTGRLVQQLISLVKNHVQRAPECYSGVL
jgi:hypothetical protein